MATARIWIFNVWAALKSKRDGRLNLEPELREQSCYLRQKPEMGLGERKGVFFRRLLCQVLSSSFRQVSVQISIDSRGWEHLCLSPGSSLSYLILLPLIASFPSLFAFSFTPDDPTLLLPSPRPLLSILCWLLVHFHCFAYMPPPYHAQ